MPSQNLILIGWLGSDVFKPRMWRDEGRGGEVGWFRSRLFCLRFCFWSKSFVDGSFHFDQCEIFCPKSGCTSSTFSATMIWQALIQCPTAKLEGCRLQLLTCFVEGLLLLRRFEMFRKVYHTSLNTTLNRFMVQEVVSLRGKGVHILCAHSPLEEEITRISFSDGTVHAKAFINTVPHFTVITVRIYHSFRLFRFCSLSRWISVVCGSLTLRRNRILLHHTAIIVYTIRFLLLMCSYIVELL